MTTEATVALGGGSAWAWAAVAVMGLGALFTLALAAVSAGVALGRGAMEGMPRLWIAAVVALVGVGFFVCEGSRQFTEVATIVVDRSGAWDLYSSVGGPLGRIDRGAG